jgi:hypothetical protein
MRDEPPITHALSTERPRNDWSIRVEPIRMERSAPLICHVRDRMARGARHVRSQCFGQMPHDLSDRVDLIETYEFDRTGIPVDDQPITQWAQAISELLEDLLKAALPGAG